MVYKEPLFVKKVLPKVICNILGGVASVVTIKCFDNTCGNTLKLEGATVRGLVLPMLPQYTYRVVFI